MILIDLSMSLFNFSVIYSFLSFFLSPAAKLLVFKVYLLKEVETLLLYPIEMKLCPSDGSQ